MDETRFDTLIRFLPGEACGSDRDCVAVGSTCVCGTCTAA